MITLDFTYLKKINIGQQVMICVTKEKCEKRKTKMQKVKKCHGNVIYISTL